MANLKKEQKNLLAQEITSRIMECLMGLNEKNEPVIQKITWKHASGIVKAYYRAIKKQHKKIRKTVIVEEQPVESVFDEATNLIAS